MEPEYGLTESCIPNAPFPDLGCVLMASGLGRRFGGNKLLADFGGAPLVQRALDVTAGIFARRVAVTRHEGVRELCEKQGVPALLHDLPRRSDAVRLGLQALGPGLRGCLFLPGDQPLLRRETVLSLALCARSEPDFIWRAACGDTVGSPVLFPTWAFAELLSLPEGQGGSAVIRSYPHRVRAVPVRDVWELADVDTPEDLERLRAYLQMTAFMDRPRFLHRRL